MFLNNKYKNEIDIVLNYLEKVSKEWKHFNEVLFLWLRWSRHFWLEEENSDYDFYAIVNPTIHELCFSKKDYNTDLKITDNISIQIIPINALTEHLNKMSFNLIEWLTLPVYYKQEFEDIFNIIKNTLKQYNTFNNKFALNLYFIGKKNLSEYYNTDYNFEKRRKALAKAYLFHRIVKNDIVQIQKSIDVYFEDNIPKDWYDDFKEARNWFDEPDELCLLNLDTFYQDNNNFVEYLINLDKLHNEEILEEIKENIILLIKSNIFENH